jgi:hypothetical protein
MQLPWDKTRVKDDHLTSLQPSGILRQILTALLVWGLLIIANQDADRHTLWSEACPCAGFRSLVCTWACKLRNMAKVELSLDHFPFSCMCGIVVK